jgi:hypothetical protein
MNKGKVLLLLLVPVAMMLGYTGCGESRSEDQSANIGKVAQGSEARAGVISPCSLISKAQVEEIFGEPFQDGEDKSLEKNLLGQRICFCRYPSLKPRPCLTTWPWPRKPFSGKPGRA